MDQGTPIRFRLSWLALLPALIAAMLALVYALGALAFYGQLRDAGLDAVQTMPLVPVEQILGRGIGSIASIFGRAMISLALAGLIIALYWSERNERKFVPPREWGWRTVWFLLIPVFFGVTLPWETALVTTIGMAVMVGAWALAGMAGLSGWPALFLIGGGSLLSIVPLSIAASFIEPPPLPVVELQRVDQPVVEGGLVAETSTAWYIATAEHRVIAIPNAEVVRAGIEYSEREHAQSPVESIF